MAVETKYKMSQARFDELKQELHILETVKEREVAELIKEARSFGDLSENSEYEEAKNEQAKLYSKITELHKMLENAEIIEPPKNAMHIGLGSHVRVKCLADGEVEEYWIVGSQEANPMQGRLSDDSPFGKVLVGSKVGDVITVEAPVGAIEYEILRIGNE
ncbi:MAG: transcription elongation factor GreA [Oscillospiraceae bacterium]|jgi:transcription elongation factor GreA|nr:transcription elongation factor GreA [Oscillospiraceae bacterium]